MHDFTKSLSRSAPSTVSATTIVSSLLTVQTSGRGFTDLTAEVAKFVEDAGASEGAVTLFIRHTSASLTIQENADPTVLDRFDDGARPPRAGGCRMAPRHRRSRRHAGACQDHADGDLAADSRAERRTRARNLAGDLPDRASRAAARREIVLQFIGADAAEKQNRPRSDPRPAACVSLSGRLSPPASDQFVLISTSLVSGRKKKPTTTVIAAKMIGYQRPA